MFQIENTPPVSMSPFQCLFLCHHTINDITYWVVPQSILISLLQPL